MIRTLLTTALGIGLMHASAQTQGITIQMNVQHASCGSTTGGITAWVWGGAQPYTLLWSPAPPSGQGTNSISDAAPGTYTLMVTDANGTVASAEATIILTPDLFPSIVGATAWGCNAGCSGSYYSYLPLPGAGAPYSVSFDPPGPTGGASANGLYFNGLCVGQSYDITVSNVNGCTGTLSGLQVLGPMAPTIVNETITPSCPNGATGGFIVEFSDVDSIYVSLGQGNGTLAGNIYTATSLAPGTYTIWVGAGNGSTTPPGTSGTWCTATFSIEVPETTDPCGTLGGRLYADLNADCAQGAEDPGLPYRVIGIEPDGLYTLTDANGNIATELLYGAYALTAEPAGYTVVCAPMPAAITLDAANPSANITIAAAPTSGPDASAFVMFGQHRPGLCVTYGVSATNQGPFTMPGAVLDLFFDPLLIVNGTDGGTLIAAGHLQWQLGSLTPFSSASFWPNLCVPADASLIGTTITATAVISFGSPDGDPTNDAYVRTTTIVGSFDPNDKLAQTSTRSSDAVYYLDADHWIDYTIRFQNTGNAEAINVFLIDTISPLLDLGSLEILGASHAFTAQLRPGRVLRFDFPGILLPDSASDLLGSQGFASFRIRPVSALPVGAVLANNADIFFDFNEPVRTNTATLIAEFSTAVPQRGHGSPILAPNPVRDLLTISAPAGSTRIEVLGADGRLVLTAAPRDAILRIDAQRLAPGVYTVRCLKHDKPLGHGRFVKE